MVGKLFLIIGLGVTGLCWLLAVQMRGLTAHALRLAGQDQFKSLPAPDVNLAVRAAPLTETKGVLSEPVEAARLWLRETYPKAVRHLAIARRASVISPVAGLIIVVIWRFVWGGAA